MWTAIGPVLVSTSLDAQGLRDKISELFIFTAGKDPLFLGRTADPNNPATIQLHANPFIPAARAKKHLPAPRATQLARRVWELT